MFHVSQYKRLQENIVNVCRCIDTVNLYLWQQKQKREKALWKQEQTSPACQSQKHAYIQKLLIRGSSFWPLFINVYIWNLILKTFEGDDWDWERQKKDIFLPADHIPLLEHSKIIFVFLFTACLLEYLYSKKGCLWIT